MPTVRLRFFVVSLLAVLVAGLLGWAPPVGADLATDQPLAADGQVRVLRGPTPAAMTVAVSADRFDAPTDAAVLTRDDVFADALAGSGLLATMPLLATGSGALDPQVADELVRATVPGARVYLLGGPVALSPQVASQVAALGRIPVRLAGPTREDTAVAIADVVAAGGPVGTVVLARGWSRPGLDTTSGWVDAIAVGAWAAATATPLLLVGDTLPDATADALVRLRPARVVIVGGQAAVSDDVAVRAARVAAGFGATTVRLDGPTRGDTAVAVAKDLWGRSPAGGPVVVVRGDTPLGWVAGLAGAGLAADLDAPVLLSGPRSLMGAPGCPSRAVGIGVAGDLTGAGLDAGMVAVCGILDLLDPAPAPAPEPEPEPAPDPDPDAYVYLHVLPDGTPLRYDHCQPLEVAANFTDAPADARAALADALEELGRVGIDVVDVGTTDLRAGWPSDSTLGGADPRQPDGSWRPIVVSWPPAHTWDDTGAIGYGGSAYVTGAPTDPAGRYLFGSIQLDPSWTTTTTLLTALLLHEFGHVLGLGHVDDPDQLMNTTLGPSTPSVYAAGDRSGLAGLLAAAC